ncbi:Phenylalanine aminomutase (L-beta-phenylalanine forming) [Pseudocercospora fuligena]|uniref:Phenylalanine aminomutase (L-beta-phenylalanine forming) n=1 Tax=Pseudocercospora fuligena TaxID=685502 RepID=A0A8H6RC45_9PEZI|nr:Phenylalanine aminomutase (L-beta-phenylalanine forming) [Pseudocercospora fuligena]
MFSQKYEPLSQSTATFSKEGNEDARCHCHEQRHEARQSLRTVITLTALLILSIACNAILFARIQYVKEHGHDPTYVGLERNLNLEIPHDDRTIDDPMWDNPEYDWNLGWVALDNDVAHSKGIPTAMHWPWDDSKSIYVLHGFHSIHCVFVLRDSLMQFRDGKEQSWPFPHVTHCLHVLREDTTCNADDTPRYTGHLHAQENSTTFFSGIGQTRQCRDWNQLRDFAIENSACYRRPLDHFVPLLDRYKNCPDGSTPWDGHELA